MHRKSPSDRRWNCTSSTNRRLGRVLDVDRFMLVTGGSRGIGAAVARGANANGYRGAITLKNSAAAADGLVAEGVVALAVRADAGDEASIVASFAEAVDAFG